MIPDLFKKFRLNFKFDFSFISLSDISFSEKISFLARKYFNIFTNKRKIKYLGKEFYYDTQLSPAILETYPREIFDINKTVKLSKIKTLLDVGANIGQFSYSLKSFFPHLQIYAFEPNKNVFPILKKNIGYFKNIKAYNFGLGGKTGKRSFYFSPSASAEGSFYKENVNQNYIRKDAQKTEVDIINLTPGLTKKLSIPHHIDLVKIDVEGAEMEVLKSLIHLDFDYLYIEVSIKRKETGDIEDIKKFLKDKKGIKPQIIYYNLPDKESPCANVMFSLKH